MAFVAPMLQGTTRKCTSPGECSGARTDQNAFFDTTNMVPLLDNEAFRHALTLFKRLVQSSNCQDELLSPTGSNNPYALGRLAKAMSKHPFRLIPP